MQYRKKAYGCIIEGGRVLVFREQLAGREDAPQFPGGTVEAGEAIETALLREIYEESGLSDLAILRQLGCDTYYASAEMTALRHFYLLKSTEPLRETWLHYEEHSSEQDRPLPYLYSLMPIEEARLGLAGWHHRFLHLI